MVSTVFIFELGFWNNHRSQWLNKLKKPVCATLLPANKSHIWLRVTCHECHNIVIRFELSSNDHQSLILGQGGGGWEDVFRCWLLSGTCASEKEDADWTLLKGGILNGLTSSMGCRNAWDPNMGVHCTDLLGKSWENIGTAVGWKVAVRIQRTCFAIHRGCPSTQKPQSQKNMRKHVAGLQHRCCIAWDTAVKQELSTKRLFQMFQACSWISTNWLPRKQFLHQKAEQLKHRPNLSVFGSPQNAAQISTAVFYTRSAMLWNLLLYTTWVYTWRLTYHMFPKRPTSRPMHARTWPPKHMRLYVLDCFGTCPKKKIGSSSRRSVTIGVQGTLFQSSASRQTPPAKLLRVSAWACEEILCQKRASKLYEHHWKSHMSGTLLQPEPQDGTKMLRTDSRTDIPQATRTGLVRSPSCSPISWRWKPLAMIASMASHKSFTTWHSALIQLKTIAKHLASPKLNNVDWKGDEFTYIHM